MSSLGDAILMVSRAMFKNFTYKYYVAVAEIDENKELNFSELKAGQVSEVYKDGELQRRTLAVDGEEYEIAEYGRSIGELYFMYGIDRRGGRRAFLAGSMKRLLRVVGQYESRAVVAAVDSKNGKGKVLTVLVLRKDEGLDGPVVVNLYSDLKFGNIFKYWKEAQRMKELLRQALKDSEVYYDASAGIAGYPLLEFFLGKDRVHLVRFKMDGRPVVLV